MVSLALYTIAKPQPFSLRPDPHRGVGAAIFWRGYHHEPPAENPQLELKGSSKIAQELAFPVKKIGARPVGDAGSRPLHHCKAPTILSQTRPSPKFLSEHALPCVILGLAFHP